LVPDNKKIIGKRVKNALKGGRKIDANRAVGGGREGPGQTGKGGKKGGVGKQKRSTLLAVLTLNGPPAWEQD